MQCTKDYKVIDLQEIQAVSCIAVFISVKCIWVAFYSSEIVNQHGANPFTKRTIEIGSFAVKSSSKHWHHLELSV